MNLEAIKPAMPFIKWKWSQLTAGDDTFSTNHHSLQLGYTVGQAIKKRFQLFGYLFTIA